MPASWLTDTLPSLPAPPSKTPAVDLGGFCFTAGGIAHPITQSTSDDILLSAFLPEDQIATIAQNLGLA